MSSGDEASKQDNLAELLQQLKVDTVPATVTLEGRAVGRTETKLSLAISTGIVEVPLEEIHSVSFLDPADKTIVSLEVKDGTKVTHALAMSATPPEELRIIGGGGGPVHSATGTGFYIDSVTRTGGKADKTDDTNWVQKVDDYLA